MYSVIFIAHQSWY